MLAVTLGRMRLSGGRAFRFRSFRKLGVPYFGVLIIRILLY